MAKLIMAKGNIVVEAASEYLFEHEGDHGDEENPIVFQDWSNAEKLNLVEAHRDIVILNAAAAIIAGGLADDFESAKSVAEESVRSGKAKSCLEKLIEVSNS
ncbi:MAG: hypothetical protein IIB83_05400 [Bacteroidetes bacterium]|nr:hypothetical protein [Bacteroidota bacterium]